MSTPSGNNALAQAQRTGRQHGRRQRAISRLRSGVIVAAVLSMAGPGRADRVTTAAQLHFGVQDQAMPFAYQLDDGRAGYTVEICQQVMAALKAHRGKPYANPPETRWFSVTPQTRLIRLLAGDIDLECSTTSQTPARSQLGLVFSLPIFVSDVGVLLRSPTARRRPAPNSGWRRCKAAAQWW